MGLNILLYDAGGKEVPEWDWIRYAGDRDFAKLAGTLPHESRNRCTPPDIEWEYRPSDFVAWRAAVAAQEWPNPGRYEHLLDLMEQRPDTWLYFSY